MGLLKTIGSKLAKGAKNVLDTNLALFSAPKTTLTKGLSAGIKETQSKTGVQNLKSTLVTTAVASATVLTAGTSAGRTAVASVAKAITPTSLKGKVIGALAVPVIAGAVINRPKESIKTVAKAPFELAKFGSDVSSFATNPTIANAKQIVSESPVISSAVALTGAVAVAKVGGNVISGILQKEAVQDQTKAIEAQTEVIKSQGSPSLTIPTTQTQPSLSGVSAPQVAQTAPLIASTSGTSSKKRYKARKQTKIPSVNQRVNVIVSSRANGLTNKNYIKREVLAT
jgi:hypothetical protein